MPFYIAHLVFAKYHLISALRKVLNLPPGTMRLIGIATPTPNIHILWYISLWRFDNYSNFSDFLCGIKQMKGLVFFQMFNQIKHQHQVKRLWKEQLREIGAVGVNDHVWDSGFNLL